jgi:uncharacterized membrane-anchored protein YhcB (DUF1043 family)
MMQGLDIEPFVAAVIALVGVAVGLAIGRFVLPGTRKIKRLESEIEQLRRAHADYRSRVSSHFHKTSELVGQMTASYKAVYDHLADGAQTLCAGDALPGPAFPAPRLILADNVEVTAEGVAAGRTGAAPAGATLRAPADSASGAQPPNETMIEPTPERGANEGVAQTADAGSARPDTPSGPAANS